MLGIALAVVTLYFLFDPMESGWMPQCVFHKVTGWQCMGCGSQRMVHAMLHGDFVGAFKANAFVFCSLPVIAGLMYVEMKRTRYPKLYKSVHSVAMIIIVSAMLGAWLIFRNIMGI